MSIATVPTATDGLGQMSTRVAATYPDRVALVTPTRTLTFAELDQDAGRLASSLADLGVAPGDRIAIFAQNRWEWVVSYHAILRAGAVVIPANVMLTADELTYMLADAGASVLLASAERLAGVAAALRDVASLRHVISFDETELDTLSFTELVAAGSVGFAALDVDPGSLACLAYTSGTTGRPKGAMQSQRSLVLNCALTAAMHGRTETDVVVSPLPCSHVYGNIAINGTLMVGGTVVLLERFDPATVLGLVERHRATLLEGVPAMYAMLLDLPELAAADLTSLRRCTVGGQTIAKSVIEAWEARCGAPLLELWGMTELSGLGTTHALHAPNVHGSIGVSLPGVEVRTVSLEDPTREAGPNEKGELLVRGPIVMLGYHNNPEATRQTIDPAGWLHTGDVATHDGLGHFFVVDRLKDMIVTGGYNIYPAEIERVLIGHPAVALVAVGREPDPVKGEVAHAYVVPAARARTDTTAGTGAEADAEELLAYCRTRLAAYKVPRAVHFVDALPTTSSGKLMRRKLRQGQSSGMPDV
ncbi:class I adenylate-forming enzyme family protein [Frankia sp. R43]|uniref:class I adenylate-forming enzyme family protein n=1 Tax=Frankia sp. R43 TaxID=269536 RepID=UPI0009F9394B|nr:AMP-binding protein [Frankia sp. R43]